MWSWHLRLGSPPNWVGCMMECSMAAVSSSYGLPPSKNLIKYNKPLLTPFVSWFALVFIV